MPQDPYVDFLSPPPPTQRTESEKDAEEPMDSTRRKEKRRSLRDRFSFSFKRAEDEEDDLAEDLLELAQGKTKTLNHERDYFRQDTRVQAWDSYVLVSVLCTSISYNALQNFELNEIHQGVASYEAVKSVIQIVAGTAVLAGLYATMVFSLSILYGKSALGLERDPQYDSFLASTGKERYNGFRAFSLTLALFSLLVVMVLSEDLPFVLHLPVGGAMIGALYVGYRDYNKIVDAATPIYKGD